MNNLSELIEKYSNILEPYNKNWNLDELNYKLFNNISFINNHKIFISLSGGVDSMVLLHLLLLLKYNDNKIEIIAIHINYNNRNESILEDRFLSEYCDLYNVKFESLSCSLKRGSINRSQYEKKTHDLRYNFYQLIINKYSNNSDNLNEILLGHHKDDIIENIFSNFCRGRSLLDLSVIKEFNQINNVKIRRPLIDIYKDDIYKYAHYHNIPYFLNTTPDWSVRGKLRNTILPSLESVFTTFKCNLLSINKDIDDWSIMINNQITEYIQDNVLIENNEKSIRIKYIQDKYPFCFWMEIIKRTFHKIGLNCPSRRSIENLLNSKFSVNIKLNNNIVAKNCDNYLYFYI